jgi:lipopolysaccharide export system permease protein
MRVLDRYVSTEFLRSWMQSLGAFVTIYVVVNLFEKIDKFLENKVALTKIISYYLYLIPYIIKWINPIAVLLAVLFSLGALSKQNEISAMKSCGVSFIRIVVPIAVLALIISAVVAVWSETVVPWANENAEKIKLAEIDKKPARETLRRERVAITGEEGYFYYITSYDNTRKILNGIDLQKLDAEGKIVFWVTAKTGRWQDDHWVFYDGIKRELKPVQISAATEPDIKQNNQNKKPNEEKAPTRTVETLVGEPFDRYIPPVKEKPIDFMQVYKDPEEMSYDELASYISRLTSRGAPVDKLMVELYLKLAVPFANFIVILIGAPLAIQSQRSGMALGFAVAVLLGFTLWGLLAVFRALGQSGDLPPFLAAWIPDISFGLLGGFMLARSRS